MMNVMANIATELASLEAPKQLLRLVAGSADAMRPNDNPFEAKIFQLDADFAAHGAWAGVADLAERAYLGLLTIDAQGIIDAHHIALHTVLAQYRDRIPPRYPCLTDTAIDAERTRFHPLDRAYRAVHGLVGMILQWKRAKRDRTRWIIVVRNFDQAQHLATRFFGELAQRAAPQAEIDVIIETRLDTGGISQRMPKLRTMAAPGWIPEMTPKQPQSIDTDRLIALETAIADGSGIELEQHYPVLLQYYEASGNRLAGARLALKAFVLYTNHGYYYEARRLLEAILPNFDRIAGADEEKRMYYVGKMTICLVMTSDPEAAVHAIEHLAAPYVTDKRLLASMNYMLGMHHLRYAKARSVERAEHHILQAVSLIREANEDPASIPDPFRKVFIDNALAFVRARQGRYQDSLDLCQSGYAFLTREVGEEHHQLHRSVLQFNIANVYVMLQRLDDAIAYYRNAIAMDPNYSEYHNEIGNLLQEQENYQDAITHYQLAIERSAPYPEVFFNKAICHLNLSETHDALTCFDISLELDPDQPQAQALRADIHRELGLTDDAIRGYDTALALGLDSTAVRVNRAVLLYDIGSYGQALADMDAVIAQQPDAAEHYENRAAIHLAMSNQALYEQDLASAARYGQAA